MIETITSTFISALHPLTSSIVGGSQLFGLAWCAEVDAAMALLTPSIASGFVFSALTGLWSPKRLIPAATQAPCARRRTRTNFCKVLVVSVCHGPAAYRVQPCSDQRCG